MYSINVLKKYGIKIANVRGDEVLAHCPFHHDEHPSFAANLKKGVFICFACGEKGNFSSFGEDFTPKIHWNDFKELLPKEEVQMLFDLPKEFIQINPLFLGKFSHLEYLLNRDVKKEIIKKFNIGYCKHGFYGDRIIIPLEMGFVARTIREGKLWEMIYGIKLKRYLYPLGLPISKMLFNCPHHSEKKKSILLVEGVFDVLRLVGCGIQAVSILGSQLHDVQLERLCDLGIQKVFLCFDGDDAGRKGASEAIGKLSSFFDTYNVILPEGEDPGSIDISLFKKCLMKAKTISSFCIGYSTIFSGLLQ